MGGLREVSRRARGQCALQGWHVREAARPSTPLSRAPPLPLPLPLLAQQAGCPQLPCLDDPHPLSQHHCLSQPLLLLPCPHTSSGSRMTQESLRSDHCRAHAVPSGRPLCCGSCPSCHRSLSLCLLPPHWHYHDFYYSFPHPPDRKSVV